LATIEITGKPREEREKNVIGGFLVIPLNEQPGEGWIRLFEKPVDRMEFQDLALRVPIVSQVRGNVARFLDQVVAAIEKANQKYEAQQAESKRATGIARQQGKARKQKFDSDLDGWWNDKGAVS
jgi:hypothetical protein